MAVTSAAPAAAYAEMLSNNSDRLFAEPHPDGTPGQPKKICSYQPNG
jgi:hypothetical protein